MADYMEQIKRRVFIVTILSLAVAAVVYHYENIEPIKNENLFKFPLQIGKWKGKDIQMEGWVFESLETPYAILRDYQTTEGDKINFSVVWYDDKEIAFHSASACLGGIGDRVKEDEIYNINLANNKTYKIRRIRTVKHNLERIVLYYYISDGYITGSQMELRKHAVKRRLKLKRTSAAFVRIMKTIKSDKEDDNKVIEEFFKETLPKVIEFTKTKNLMKG